MGGMKWIKIDTGIFDDSKIRLIESMPEGNTLIVIWFRLLILAGKEFTNGVFMINDKIACTDEMLATIFGKPIATIRLALETFQKLNMVDLIDGTYSIPNWNKYQSADKYEINRARDRKRLQEWRKKQQDKEKFPQISTTSKNETFHETFRKRNETPTEIEVEEEIEIEKEKEIYKEKPTRHRYGEYKNVLLTDKDLEKLKTEFPDDWEKRIERLSAYMASTGKSYKNHLATIRNWARMQKERDEKSRAAEVKQFAGNEDEEWKKQDDELHELMKERGWM
ncbi:phage replisome organizer N-terminal domain-containing protein [Acidaminococcus massiliensis]|uniref:phage replisome organizer N-terminal domain-containing protein n=1 Tax=Acidaminococcus massiliensis TaxID=1852375 RepID=UPI0022E546D0|nr:phage replisome organizer N-terminal domain-containing protein [Acidaminococcus massiliensis]